MLSAHVKPKRCEFTVVCIFRRAHRLEGETANEFAIRLRSLAAHCNFTEREIEILRQFVIGIRLPEVERKPKEEKRRASNGHPSLTQNQAQTGAVTAGGKGIRVKTNARPAVKRV